MAKRRGRSEPDGEQMLQGISALGLLVLVIGTLLIGAMLQADGPAATVTSSAPPGLPPAGNSPYAPAEPAPAALPVEPATAPPLPEEVGRLADRARADLDRIRVGRDKWTLQLAVACDAANAETLRRDAGRSDSLYLLPVELNGKACYRVVWGVYDGRDEAVRAALPAALAARVQGPQPRRVESLLR